MRLRNCSDHRQRHLPQEVPFQWLKRELSWALGLSAAKRDGEDGLGR